MSAHRMVSLTLAWLLGVAPAGAALAASPLSEQIDRLADQVEPKVIKHRRHFHKNPELSNREFETAKYVAKELKRLGVQVRTGVAKTGVIGVLRGGKPGPVIALDRK